MPAIDPEELVDATEVAQLLGLRHRNSVSTYMKRYEDFPRPLIERGERRGRFWARADILRWAAEHTGKRRGDA
jgi:glutathione-regulated potassium-efflux system ancillary protein KefG